ncbi:hypothetical protein [Tenacibaculum maritimum]|uniref:hypothetical protein n=1 Tax=Tenacibaculum maritimum TaxID=107401 RepID=UPI0013300BA2|nr:hypothetical protein [Tenacibaculum maritimum]MCD9637379.1 hypothetical protein [Tenacibaculum maritimum]
MRISRNWVRKLGFKVGDTINVITGDRLLIIESLKVAKYQQDYKKVLKEVKTSSKTVIEMTNKEIRNIIKRLFYRRGYNRKYLPI